MSPQPAYQHRSPAIYGCWNLEQNVKWQKYSANSNCASPDAGSQLETQIFSFYLHRCHLNQSVLPAACLIFVWDDTTLLLTAKNIFSSKTFRSLWQCQLLSGTFGVRSYHQSYSPPNLSKEFLQTGNKEAIFNYLFKHLCRALNKDWNIQVQVDITKNKIITHFVRKYSCK